MSKPHENDTTQRQSIGAGLGSARDIDESFAATVGNPAPHWLTLLGQSETGDRDYVPRVEGEIPNVLLGSLYRNGPGLFDRGDLRKPHLLDGDGLVQRLSFDSGKVRYQNTFVRTQKFKEEQAAGGYLYSTWSMLKPGGLFANLGGRKAESQAGVTVYPFNGALYAFDELNPPWQLDPLTLETLGPKSMGDPAIEFMTRAHTKFDAVTGDWLMAGLSFGRKMHVHAIVHGADGALKAHHVVESPRQVYVHDFLATEHYFIFILHPMMFSPWWLLAGRSSFIECMSWKRDEGNLVMVLPRTGGASRLFQAPGAFMWHALNAFERDDEIIADFVAYDAPDHFTPHDALFYQLMQGRMGNAKEHGKLRRYRIDLSMGKLQEEIVDADTHEFPMVDPRVALRPHKVGFMSAGGLGAVNTGVKRFDYESGRAQTYDFGEKAAVGEPVFAAKPGRGENDGWLLTQVLDGASEKAFFALFDASSVEQGPIAKIWLSHHLPISFHGSWAAA